MELSLSMLLMTKTEALEQVDWLASRHSRPRPRRAGGPRCSRAPQPPVRCVLGLARQTPRPPPTLRAPPPRLALTSCARISCGVRLRTRPMRAVAQNLQPWSQPTWLLMHSVVLGRWACGIKTASTARPSASRTSSFVVPSAASSACSSAAGTNAVHPHDSSTRLAPIGGGARRH